MSLVDRGGSFIGGNSAKASEVNSDFDTLYNVINGDLDERNLNLNRAELRAALLAALKLVDGANSGLDADLLDGKELATIRNEITTEINDEITTNAYTDADAVSAVNAETSLSVDITGDANTVNGYEIQKNGIDGAGIINFKTD